MTTENKWIAAYGILAFVLSYALVTLVREFLHLA
jgi:hypothetical protein